MKKTRKMVTFRPKEDVDAMFDRAQKAGLSITEIVNEAMRESGDRIIKSCANKAMKRLNSLSFSFPDRQFDLEFAA